MCCFPGRWVPCGRTDGDTPEVEVTGLEPGHKYEFRVKAVNDEGESDPLEGDRAVLAKDPFGKLILLVFSFSIIFTFLFHLWLSLCM